ncbi:MAG: hypothetical protein COT17_02890 [Elusimicrobia bacterium CG08_land_8_20_14_0_20_51_18]|nr:MAG: hypothetical protein COT17_02890 [Elusimicrobia bacterium CG08_land_8_20_14_0_20_51_18]
MQKTPAKNIHTKRRGFWAGRLKIKPDFRGELTEHRACLKRLITTAQETTLQIGTILKEKVNEQNKLKKQLDAAFKKTPSTAHRKALSKTRTDLENHLHHTMRELDLKKAELKEIYHEANYIKERLRKG